jgi:SMI1 / KNR4 family (SUKH-1)
MNLGPNRWLSSEGASPQVLAELRSAVGALPQAYIELLSRGNGGEVELRCKPLVLCLDPAESALDYWRSGTYTKAGVFVFGGDGGGELLAFDLSVPGKCPVICFDPIDPDGSTEVVAADFESLLAHVREHDA